MYISTTMCQTMVMFGGLEWNLPSQWYNSLMLTALLHYRNRVTVQLKQAETVRTNLKMSVQI